jgi:hypothetical protein
VCLLREVRRGKGLGASPAQVGRDNLFDCLNWLNSRRDRHVHAARGGWVVSGYEPVFVVADMPAAADHYKSSDSTSAPENKPRGKYEGSHVDPDGNIIRFGSPHRDEG